MLEQLDAFFGNINFTGRLKYKIICFYTNHQNLRKFEDIELPVIILLLT